MTQEHPIIPPPELIEQWVDILIQGSIKAFTTAAQWGADEELEACCKMLYDRYDRVRHATGFPGSDMSDWLRAARRPKTASLKEKALEAVKQIPVEPDSGPWRTAMETIILALRQLPDNN